MGVRQILDRFGDRLRHRDGPWATLFAPYDGDECVSLDCETTSLDPQAADILSIGAVRVRGRRVLTSDKLELYVQPPPKINHDSMRVHGLRGVDLAQGLDLRDALTRLLDYIGNRPLLGYYVAYDVAVLNRPLRALFGFSLPNRTIELSALYRRRLHQHMIAGDPDLSLEAIAAKLGMPPFGGRHTAVGDAISVAMMYIKLQQRARVAF